MVSPITSYQVYGNLVTGNWGSANKKITIYNILFIDNESPIPDLIFWFKFYHH
jgi:hypothetical protein